MNKVYLEKGELMSRLSSLIGYKGTKICVEISDKPMSLHSYWDGGSYNDYDCFDMNGNRVEINYLIQTAPLPFWKDGKLPDYIPTPDKFLVEHVTFCGKDLGLHVYIHPACVMTKMLPDNKPNVSKNELFVLNTICSLKSFARADEYRNAGFTTAEIDKLKEILYQKGFINKAGAITPTGRNVVNSAFNSIGERQEFSWRFKKEQVIDIAKDA